MALLTLRAVLRHRVARVVAGGVALLVVLVVGRALIPSGDDDLPSVMPPPTLPEPSFAKIYPTQIFTARSSPREVKPPLAGEAEGELAENTFRLLTPQDITEVQKMMKNGTANTVAQRQYLAQHGYSWTPEGFMSAARKGDLEAVRSYLVAGMEPSTRNQFSSTPLHAAAETNQLEVAKLLLAAGGDPNSATTQLQTPLHRAVAQGHLMMIKLLLAAGSNANAATLEGWTPLSYAVDANNQAVVELLVNADAGVNSTDRFGYTPLMLAVRKNYVQLVRRLIYLGANVNARDLTGRTPLHDAVSGGYYQLVKMLLENGSRADIRDRKGQLPMDIALANQDLAIANLLLAHGSKRAQTLGTGERGIRVPKSQQQKISATTVKKHVPRESFRPATIPVGPSPVDTGRSQQPGMPPRIPMEDRR